MHAYPPTPLDVLDNWRAAHDLYDGRSIGDLTDEAFDDFVERLDQYNAAWEPPARDPDEIRLLLDVAGFWGSLLLPASAVTFTDSDIDLADAQNASGGVLTHLRRRYATAFLYADRVVDLDPLVMVERAERDSRAYVMSVLINLYEAIRPAVEARLLVMAPDASREEMTRVNEASLLDEDGFANYFAERHGEHRSFEWIFLREVRRAALVAERASASVLAAHPWVWDYVTYVGGTGPSARDITVATSLLHAELPIVGGISAKTLVAIHKEEDAFVGWRNALRTTARLIRSTPTDQSFTDEAAAVYEETLLPRIAAIRRSVSRSAALRGAVLEEPARAALGAVCAAGPAAVAGMPIRGLVLSAAAGAVSNAAYRTLRPPRPAGADAIISLLAG